MREAISRRRVYTHVPTTKPNGEKNMRQLGKMVVAVILLGGVATGGHAQTGPMPPDQMKTMGDHMRTMSDQMKGGKMTSDQMKMMGEQMQEMADRMKSGQAMTAEQMKAMNEHMKMMKEHMQMGKGMKGKMEGEHTKGKN